MQEQATAAEAPWWKRAVFYQVYPRSFMDGDGDGVGDLPGLLHRLPYVADLGVDAVWLSPVFRSPMEDFGYDVSDYREIDPVFGTLADFDAVVERAHALGLKLIVDQVWSHTSDRHPWFVESSGSRENDKADWYVWADARPDGTPPNNWQASFGGPAWSWSPRRRQYYLHNFLSSQPDLNFHCPAVREAILDVARFWLDRGVDGFRLDVVNYYAHDRLLRDNPVAPYRSTPPTTFRFQRHVHNKSQPETLAFVARLRGLLDSYTSQEAYLDRHGRPRDPARGCPGHPSPERSDATGGSWVPGTSPGDDEGRWRAENARMAVGEIFDDDMIGRQLEYTDGPDRLHTAYSFHLLHAARPTPELFRSALEPWQGARGWPSWSLGNHDVPRFATRLGGDDPAMISALLAILLTLRGTPFLYQGDELGLPQAEVPFERLQDPFAIAAYTGESGRDGARTPMPWKAEAPNAGFSPAAETWLPVDPRHRVLAVDSDYIQDARLLWVRGLLRIRHEFAALQVGEIVFLDAPEGVLAYERRLGDERVLCVFQLTGDVVEYVLPQLRGAAPLTRSNAYEVGETRDVLRMIGGGAAIFALSPSQSKTS